MSLSRRILIAIATAAIAGACDRPSTDLDPQHAAALRDSAEQFVSGIPLGLAEDGPIAWLRFFDEDQPFFMASDGALVFPDRDSAVVFVRQLARTVTALDLEWSDLQIEPLAPGLAVIATAYDETITDTAGTATTFGGYMTGIVHHASKGWRIRSLHWSSPVPPRH